MLDSLDSRYSKVYTESEFNKHLELSNRSYVGIGARIGMLDGHPTVLSILPNSPAQRTSTRPKDVIKRIGNSSTDGMSLEEVSRAINGDKGTKVNLKIIHPDEESELITLTRQEIDIPAVEYQLLKDKNIALFDINDFRSATRRKLTSYLKTAQKSFIKPRQSYKQSNLSRLVKLYGSLGNAYADRENYEEAIKYYG